MSPTSGTGGDSDAFTLREMKPRWITSVLVGFITMAAFWMLLVPAAEVQHVQYGSTVTLGCNISYLYDTTWLRHNLDLTPTVVLCASLRDGRPVKEFQLSPRFSVGLMNRSRALRITSVEERDLGLYYCVANVNSRLTVGRGTVLQAPGSSWFLFPEWYCVVVGSALLIMVLAVCITHCKAKLNKSRSNETSTADSA